MNFIIFQKKIGTTFKNCTYYPTLLPEILFKDHHNIIKTIWIHYILQNVKSNFKLQLPIYLLNIL